MNRILFRLLTSLVSLQVKTVTTIDFTRLSGRVYFIRLLLYGEFLNRKSIVHYLERLTKQQVTFFHYFSWSLFHRTSTSVTMLSFNLLRDCRPRLLTFDKCTFGTLFQLHPLISEPVVLTQFGKLPTTSLDIDQNWGPSDVFVDMKPPSKGVTTGTSKTV